jgi:hypothetical protein
MQWLSVIPVTFDKTEPLFMLGTLRSGSELRDFGGPVSRDESGGLSEAPQAAAARFAVSNSNGLFGSVEQVRRSLKLDYRVTVARQGYVYLMVVKIGMAKYLPSIHACNDRYIRSLCSAPELEAGMAMRRIDWFRMSDLRTAANVGTARSEDGTRIRLCPETLESVRHVFAHLVFVVADQTIRKRVEYCEPPFNPIS